MKSSRYTCKLAALFCLMLGARTAMADQGIAYALITDGATAAVSAEYSLNPGGGTITATRNGTGFYQVMFPNAGIGVGWSVQTSAYGDNANYCNLAGLWGDVLGVLVQCYDSGGVAADSPFTVLAVSNTNDKNIAFALANQPSTAIYAAPASYSYNPNGPITIIRSSAGTYQVFFGGLDGTGGTVQLTATGGGICYAHLANSPDLYENVYCVDPGGNPLDLPFVIAVIPYGVSPTGIAYAFKFISSYPYYSSNTHSEYNPVGLSSPASIEFDQFSTGFYVVTFNGLAAAQVNGGNVRATATPFFSPARCNVQSWQASNRGSGSPVGSSLQVYVRCYNLVGMPTDAEFTVLALPAMGYAYASITDGTSASVSPDSVNPGVWPATANHISTGLYKVTFPNSGIDVGWALQAVASGPTSDSCKVYTWFPSTVYVQCLSSSGVLTDSPFRVLAISNTNDKNIAFAYAGQPSTTSYTAGFPSYNPAGSITVSRSKTGSYSVVFNGLNGVGGTVQVAAVGSGDSYCVSNVWGGSNFTAGVFCFDHSGNAVDSTFSIAVIPGGATPSGIAFGWANQPTSSHYSPASAYASGGAVGVTRVSTGRYTMSFTGLNAAHLSGGYAQATSEKSTDRCAVVNWSTDGKSAILTVSVDCYNLAGALADSEYQVLLFAPVVGPPTNITVVSGSPQSAQVNTHFGLPLKAIVTDAVGEPVPNIGVEFQVASGPGGTFPDALQVDHATTDSGGVATITFTASSTPGGPYVVYALLQDALDLYTLGTFYLTNLPVTLQSIAVTPASPSIAKGQTQPFTATGTYSDSSTQNLTSQVTWASTNTGVATIGSGGVANGVGAGTSNITAALTGVTSPADVLTVTPATLQSIAVTPANPTIFKGQTQPFTATGTYSDSSTANLTGQVTWASATTSVATINGAGVANGVGAGTSNITAALTGVTSPADVLTVTAATLQSIAVTPASPSIAKGQTQPFTATGTYSDSSTANLTGQVTWASATTSVATISSAGVAAGVGAGTSNITAALNGVTSPADMLTVTPATLQSIAVTPASPSIAKGQTQPFTATGTYSDSSTQNLTSQVTWASTNTGVATITSPGGLATGVSAGTSNITAVLTGVASPADMLTVTPATLQSIAVTPANPSIVVGTSLQFTATGTYTDSSTQNLTSQVTWTSGSTSVAAIGTAGLAAGQAVGPSIISAILGTQTGTTLLTVTPLGKCDILQVGSYNLTDVQRLIDQALGAMPAANDLNADGKVDLVDIQIEVSAVLGWGCTTQ